MKEARLAATVDACRLLIGDRFDDGDHHGAAAMLLDDGTIVTGTAPEALDPSVQVCREIEPNCAAFRPAETASRSRHAKAAATDLRSGWHQYPRVLIPGSSHDSRSNSKLAAATRRR